MTKSTPKYYISPVSGRLIKSNAKTYDDLKRRRFNIDKEPCLYNVRSAHKCLNKLLRLYPDIVHPSSNFIDIPKTYKHGNVRAFIKDKKRVIGYVDKFGNKHRLYKPIHTKRPIPVVHDSFNVLADILEKQDKISEKDQKTIEKQIIKGEPLTESKNINILFNPIQNDFIPIKTKLADDEKREIINTINKELIPTQLPPITMFSNISGIIKEYDTIVGIINKDNVIQKFPEPIKIIDEHPIPGPPGPQGERGERGERGETGPQGPQGERGEVGPQGPQGERGEVGPQGPQGERGETGPQGERGEVGPQGPQGPQGERGETGPQGERGETGPQGPQGQRGETSQKGERGEVGPQGPQGERGETGPQGERGEASQKGERGETGLQGPQGPQGERGETGPQGPQGERGEAGPQGPQGERGETGFQGPQGERGETATSEPSIPDSLTLPETEKEESTVSEPTEEKEESTVSEPSEEIKTEESTVSEPTEEKEESTVSEPTEEKEESTVSEPTEEKEESTVSEPTEEIKTEESTVSEPTEEIKTEESTVSEPTEEKEESTVSEPTEEIKTEESIVSEPIEEKEESTVSEPTEEKEEQIENVISKSIVDTLPSITVIKQDDSSVLDKVLELSPVISKQETDEIIKGLQCLDGEQLDPNENRCLPCTHYGLVWDPEHKVCKTMLKEEILKEQDKNLLSDGFILNKLDIMSDEKGNVVGYLEK